jgi:hypothetical protein
MNPLKLILPIFLCLFLPSFLPAQPLRPDTLHAVLIVGPQEEGTISSIREMRKIDTLLRSKGVQVKTFYNEKALKASVLKSMQGAHIVVYDGHGTTLGDSSKPGGLVLYDEYVSSAEIRTGVKLGPQAVVVFQSVCMAAGSSADDEADIGLKEAEKRVTAYAEPFIYAGAANYFAVNFIGDGYDFLEQYVAGESPKSIFNEQASSWSKLEMLTPWKRMKGFEIGVAGNKSSGSFQRTTWVNGVKKVESRPCFKEYNLAWVGQAGNK